MRARHADNGNGLHMHWLEAGDPSPGTPMVVLLHGFPELAFSWRYQLTALAQAGFHVVAPDQRGYGRTTGWNAAPGTDLRAFRMDNLVRDVLGLVQALGKKSVHAVVGHDFGSHVAAWCALIRPDVFRSLAMLATPSVSPSIRALICGSSEAYCSVLLPPDILRSSDMRAKVQCLVKRT